MADRTKTTVDWIVNKILHGREYGGVPTKGVTINNTGSPQFTGMGTPTTSLTTTNTGGVTTTTTTTVNPNIEKHKLKITTNNSPTTNGLSATLSRGGSQVAKTSTNAAPATSTTTVTTHNTTPTYTVRLKATSITGGTVTASMSTFSRNQTTTVG